MLTVSSSAPASGQPLSRAAADITASDRLGPGTGGSELDQLRAHVAAGGTLTPVQSGTLARLLESGGAARVEGRAAPARTVADFTLTNATRADRADLKAALDYLQTSPTAAKFLATVPKGTKINIIRDGNDSYSPATNTINWDPRSGLAVSNGSGNQSAALGLLHEMDHKVNGLARPKATGDAYDNTEEKRVITGLETKVAHELREPTRTDHRGSTVVLGSSTAHTTVPAARGR